MSKKKIFTLNQAKTIGEQLGIRCDKFDLEQFRTGLGVELEHGTANQTTDVTTDDPPLTGKIALAHLTEFPDYHQPLLMACRLTLPRPPRKRESNSRCSSPEQYLTITSQCHPKSPGRMNPAGYGTSFG